MPSTRVTWDFLQKRIDRAKNYPKARWIEFCQAMLSRGYTVDLYEPKEGVSKYITVYNTGLRFKVRFSNHRPIRRREEAGSCDFFVGVTNLGVTKTEDAIKATIAALGQSPFALVAAGS